MAGGRLHPTPTDVHRSVRTSDPPERENGSPVFGAAVRCLGTLLRLKWGVDVDPGFIPPQYPPQIWTIWTV